MLVHTAWTITNVIFLLQVP